MNVAGILAYLTLFVAVPLLSYAAWRLRKLWKKYRNPVTRAHGIAVTVLLAHAIVFSLLFLNNDAPMPPVDVGATKIISRLIEFGGGFIVALTVLLLLIPVPRRRP